MKALLRRGKAILKPADTILHPCKLEHFRQRILALTLHHKSKLLHIVVRVFDDNPDLITFKDINIFRLDRKPHRPGIAQVTERSYCPDKKTPGLFRENNKDGNKNCCECSSRPEPALRPTCPYLSGRVDPFDISLSFLNQLLQKPLGNSTLGMV